MFYSWHSFKKPEGVLAWGKVGFPLYIECELYSECELAREVVFGVMSHDFTRQKVEKMKL